MKYRIYNPDGTPTTLVYDTLEKAVYMLNNLRYFCGYSGEIREEQKEAA